MKVSELFAVLGFDVDSKPINQFEDSIKNVAKEMTVTIGVATAALYALDRFVAGSVRASLALSNFEKQTGLSNQKLQQWQSAGTLANMGLTADQVTQSIQTLQTNMINLVKFGSGNARPFALLGIDITSLDPFAVLEQLRAKSKTMDPAVFTNLIKEMGLTPEFINALQLSREEFEKLSNVIYRSRSTQESLMRIGNAVNLFKQRMLALKDAFAAKLEPTLMKLLDGLYIMVSVFGNVLTLMQKIMQSNFGPFLGGLALLITAAFMPLRVLLGTLLLLLEDISVYTQGGKSLIGELFNKLPPNMRKMLGITDGSAPAPPSGGGPALTTDDGYLDLSGVMVKPGATSGDSATARYMDYARGKTREELMGDPPFVDNINRMIGDLNLSPAQNPFAYGSTPADMIYNNQKGGDVTFAPNFYIDSNQDPNDIAKATIDELWRKTPPHLRKMLNESSADMNKGVKY